MITALSTRIVALIAGRQANTAVDADPHLVAIRQIAREVGPVRQVDEPRKASRRDRSRRLAALRAER